MALSHHERWDGSGYPSGLKGEEIPVEARVVALADVYDALTTKRPYKPAFTHSKSMAIIEEGAGTHFDPDIYAVFAREAEAFRDIRQRYAEPATTQALQA